MTLLIRVAGLPPGVPEPATRLAQFGTAWLQAPIVEPAFVRRLTERLCAAGPDLRDLPLVERAEGLHRAALRLWESADKEAGEGGLLSRLEEVTGYSQPVLRLGLRRLMESITVESLLGWWHSVTEKGLRSPPNLLGIVTAGNIPGIALPALAAGLLAGAPVLVKTSRDEPLLAAAWHAALVLEAPRLAAACAVLPWTGGDIDVEVPAFESAGRLLVFGSDPTVSALEARFSPRVRGYGTGLSLAFVAAESRSAEAARALALDLAMWDQQGCLSPQVAFVEGSPREVETFGEALAEELEGLSRDLPRGRVSTGEAARIRNFRAGVEARSLQPAGPRLLTPGPALDWTVVIESRDGFEPSVLNRTLTLWPIEDLESSLRHLTPWRSSLQAAGAAVGTGRRGRVSEVLYAAGFGWVTPLGRLQDPPLRWPNKGRDLLDDLLMPPESGGSGRRGKP